MPDLHDTALTADEPLRLNDDTFIPAIGLGAYGFKGDRGVEIVSRALTSGYRLIDTAVGYDTEAEVGRAIRESGVAREAIVVTSKLPKRDHGYDAARRSIRASLDRLGLDRIDLHLIHWPNPRLGLYVDTWRALIDARADGEVRSIGVSNFNADHLDRIIDATGELPAINQIELHPHFPQVQARELHGQLGIQTQSWSPLGRGRALLTAQPVTDAARRHGATPAQVVLRWHQQLDSLPIPRSSDPGRQRENLQLSGLQLEEDELSAITALGRSARRLWGGDPETTEL